MRDEDKVDCTLDVSLGGMCSKFFLILMAIPVIGMMQVIDNAKLFHVCSTLSSVLKCTQADGGYQLSASMQLP